jgi:hypothetical protein
MAPNLTATAAVHAKGRTPLSLFEFTLVALLLTITAACSTSTSSGRTTATAQRSDEERVSERVYVLRTALTSTYDGRGVAFLVKRAAVLTVAAGYGHFAVAQAGTAGATFQLAIFMYNDEREIPLELIDAETFDANEYKDKPLVPLGLYPGAS